MEATPRDWMASSAHTEWLEYICDGGSVLSKECLVLEALRLDMAQDLCLRFTDDGFGALVSRGDNG
jgi:hypothetical protein